MIFLIVLTIIVLVDQLSKNFVAKNIKEDTKIEIIKNSLYITNLKNTGAAYGFLGKKRKLLLTGSFGALIFMVWHFIEALRDNSGAILKLGSALTLGGGLSNIFDRVCKKKVTDFIMIKKIKTVPVVNIADIAVFFGLIFIVIGDLRRKK